MIPSMGGEEIGAFLREQASKVKPGEAIMELGTFLGAGTIHLARGAAPGVEVHAFDRFLARAHEIKIAKNFGVELAMNEDTLPRVILNMGKVSNRVTFHKVLMQDVAWTGAKIALYVDDVNKRGPAFLKALRTFSPFWIPGRTVLVLMDYWFFKKHPNDEGFRFQHEYMTRNAHKFQQIAHDFGNTSVAAFLYTGGIDNENMRMASNRRTICEVLREANDLSQDRPDVRKLLAEAQDMAKRMSRKLLEYNKEVFTDWWADNPDYEADVLRRIDENYLA